MIRNSGPFRQQNRMDSPKETTDCSPNVEAQNCSQMLAFEFWSGQDDGVTSTVSRPFQKRNAESHWSRLSPVSWNAQRRSCLSWSSRFTSRNCQRSSSCRKSSKSVFKHYGIPPTVHRRVQHYSCWCLVHRVAEHRKRSAFMKIVFRELRPSVLNSLSEICVVLFSSFYFSLAFSNFFFVSWHYFSFSIYFDSWFALMRKKIIEKAQGVPDYADCYRIKPRNWASGQCFEFVQLLKLSVASIALRTEVDFSR